MRLYLMRHGHAEPAGAGTSDHDRRLTQQGEARITAAARVLHGLDVMPDRLYSSPRLRALRTAELVGQVLGVPVEVREEVNFGFNVAAIHGLTRDLSTEASVMFVGHEPSMSMAVGELSGAEIAMKKGGLARIDLPGGVESQGELVWLIAPKIFDVLDDDRT